MKQLFYNGEIVTPEASGAEAVLVEDGVIRDVGSRESLWCQAGDCRIVNLHGAALLPAFIDAHSHFSQVAARQMQADLADAGTPEEIARRIRAFLAAGGTAPGTWVQAAGYDHNLLPGGRQPSLALLDSCVPDHPLMLQHKSGHSGVCNSAALRALGITADTPDPPGGKIGRDSDGALTGYLEENAFFEAQKKVPLPDLNTFLRAYRDAQGVYASHGITTVQEGMMVPELLPLCRALVDSGLLKLDLVGYAADGALSEAAALFPRSVGRYDRHFRLGGLKIFLDGSPQSRTAWMRTPYAAGGGCGYGTLDDDAVLAAMETAARGGWQLLAHCNGDAAAAQYLRCLARAEEAYPGLRELRPVLIHAQLLGTDQLDEVRRLGVIPSFFAAHVFHWGDVHIRNFGPERAASISPAGSALRRGIRFTFHQDAPVIPPDMVETLWCAVNRRTKGGVLLGPEERITPLAALRAVTVNAAWQYGEERRKGVITPGRAADLTVLSQNPLTVPPEELRELQVLAAYKDGEPVFGE
ncbi:MAG: amidohydrolase [Oscillibacter sp.]|jgi:predicted amidohydrolase YtcJ|nr:amidohydrolase [Oscillibacter sp.]